MHINSWAVFHIFTLFEISSWETSSGWPWLIRWEYELLKYRTCKIWGAVKFEGSPSVHELSDIRYEQNSIQINLIPHLLTVWNQIIEQSSIVLVWQMELHYCCWANGLNDWFVVQQRGTTLRGRRPENWCVFGDYPLHNPRKQTDSICRGLGLDEVIMHEAELQPHRPSTHTHTHTRWGAWAH